MSAIFLLPGLLSLYLVIRGRMRHPFLSVYFPPLVVPQRIRAQIPSFSCNLRGPVGVDPDRRGGVVSPLGNRIPSLMDILVTLFIFSSTLSEVLRERVMNDSIFAARVAFYRSSSPTRQARDIDRPAWLPPALCDSDSVAGSSRPLRMAQGQSLYGIVGQDFAIWTVSGHSFK